MPDVLSDVGLLRFIGSSVMGWSFLAYARANPHPSRRFPHRRGITGPDRRPDRRDPT